MKVSKSTFRRGLHRPLGSVPEGAGMEEAVEDLLFHSGGDSSPISVEPAEECAERPANLMDTDTYGG